MITVGWSQFDIILLNIKFKVEILFCNCIILSILVGLVFLLPEHWSIMSPEINIYYIPIQIYTQEASISLVSFTNTKKPQLVLVFARTFMFLKHCPFLK